MELNKKFNEFVWNYQLAYQGPNTLKGQIDTNVKDANKTGKNVISRLINYKFIGVVLCVIEYSDFLDKEMRRPGCECLPLGKRFQDHVKYFTKPKYVLSSTLMIILFDHVFIMIIILQILNNDVSTQSWDRYSCHCESSYRKTY